MPMGEINKSRYKKQGENLHRLIPGVIQCKHDEEEPTNIEGKASERGEGTLRVRGELKAKGKTVSG